MAERIRAGGAGIYALLHEDGCRHDRRRGQGAAGRGWRALFLETGLAADVSLVKAWKGDTEGNLIYRKTARNFNPEYGDRRTGHDGRGRNPGRSRASSIRTRSTRPVFS